MAAVERIELAYNNVYAVRRGMDSVLVDTGPDYSGARERLTTTLPSLPTLVVATHGHLDHAGLGAHWTGVGVPVTIGERDAHLATAPALATPEAFADMIQFVRGCGAPPGVIAEAEAGLRQRRAWARRASADSDYPAAGSGSRWPTGLRFRPFDPSGMLHSGDELPADLHVIACPGHTPGNLVLTHQSEGWLFSGDQLLPEITPTPAIQHLPPGETGTATWRFRSLPAFVNSLHELRRHDFSRCFPGHGDPFDNVAETIDANLAQVEDRTERAAAVLRTRGRASLYAIAEGLYPRALRRRFWQIIATVQGHVDVLEDAGRATFEGGSYTGTDAT